MDLPLAMAILLVSFGFRHYIYQRQGIHDPKMKPNSSNSTIIDDFRRNSRSFFPDIEADDDVVFRRCLHHCNYRPYRYHSLELQVVLQLLSSY